MINFVILFSLFILCVAFLLTVYSLVKHKSIPDRIMSLDTLTIESIGLIILYGIWTKSDLYFSISLLIAGIAFVSTVALCKFLLKGDIIQ